MQSNANEISVFRTALSSAISAASPMIVSSSKDLTAASAFAPPGSCAMIALASGDSVLHYSSVAMLLRLHDDLAFEYQRRVGKIRARPIAAGARR